MATAGGSRFSPFNLFFVEISTRVGGDRDKAMKWWNDLDANERHEFVRRSESIKEAVKTSGRPPESRVTTDTVFENFVRLEGFIHSGDDMLRRSMKLICVQYSAHHKAVVDSASGLEETRYFPNEISVVTFSFIGGVEMEAHCFVLIPEEDLPSYCRAEMKDRREEIHFIPYDEDEVRGSGLAPIEPVAKKALEKMFGARGDEETMTFCLSEDREVLHGGVKTLVNYVPNPDDAREFLSRSVRTYDFEDLLPLLSPRPEESREMLARSFKDRLADDVQSAVLCRCGFHRELDETEVHCTLLRAHSALHLVFDTCAKELNLTLTRRHICVEEAGLKRCSSSFYAEYPEKAPEEDRVVWFQCRVAKEAKREEDYYSPRRAQSRFLESLRDPEYAGEEDLSADRDSELRREPRLDPRQEREVEALRTTQPPLPDQRASLSGCQQAPRAFSYRGRGRGFVDEDSPSPFLPTSSSFGAGHGHPILY